jgi:hypothetical protein
MHYEINDDVLVFGKYEGTILEIKGENVLIYCPAYNIAEPYLTTHISNIQLILSHSNGLLN